MSVKRYPWPFIILNEPSANFLKNNVLFSFVGRTDKRTYFWQLQWWASAVATTFIHFFNLYLTHDHKFVQTYSLSLSLWVSIWQKERVPKIYIYLLLTHIHTHTHTYNCITKRGERGEKEKKRDKGRFRERGSESYKGRVWGKGKEGKRERERER
jgi:hypothetical protein